MREVIFAADDVPGFGWRSYRIDEGEGPTTAVRADGYSLANEHVQVDVDPHDGTFAIAVDGVRIEGANRYVDGGDGGDTYNYSPPTDDRIVDRPTSVRVEVLERGPVRARLLVIATYEWPTHAIGDERSCSARSDDTVTSEVRTTLELRTDERFLRVRVDFDNRGSRSSAARALSRCPRRSTARAPSARSRSCGAGSPRKVVRTSSGSPRSSPVVSSTRATAALVSRSCTTACSSTKWSTTGASSRSRCCARPVTSRVRRSRCAPTPRAHSTRCAAPSSRSHSHSSTRSSCIAATGRRRRCTTSPTKCWCPSVACAAEAGWARPASATGARLTVERRTRLRGHPSGRGRTAHGAGVQRLAGTVGGARRRTTASPRRRRRRPPGRGRRAVRGSARRSARGRSPPCALTA